MEHDLRDRMRTIQREAERAIDEADPGPIWKELVAWLDERVASAVSDTFVWTSERAQWLSARVAEHFDQDEPPRAVLAVGNTEEVLDPVEPVPALDPGRVGPIQKVFIGLRGSYGGVLMFGLLTGIAGMSLINPFSIGAGVLIGGKAYRDEMDTRLKHRQAEAKTLVRAHIDEVIFQVGKQLKDRLRIVQRATRDHYSEIADEHHRSLGNSVLAAQKAASAYTDESERRTKEIKADLQRVMQLRNQAQVVGGHARCGGTALSTTVSAEVPELLRDAMEVYGDGPDGTRGASQPRPAARRAVARSHRWHGQGRQVDPAERPHR